MKTHKLRTKTWQTRHMIRAFAFTLGLTIVLPALFFVVVHLFLGGFQSLIPSDPNKGDIIIGMLVIYGVLLLIPQRYLSHNAVTLGAFLLIPTFFSWRAIEGIRDVLDESHSSGTMNWIGVALCIALAVTIWNSIQITKEWRTSRRSRRRTRRLIKLGVDRGAALL